MNEIMSSKTKYPRENYVDPTVRYRLFHEMCACGHLRITHAGEINHGFCCHSKCDCLKFTWGKNVIE